jgi:hypothetical protein
LILSVDGISDGHDLLFVVVEDAALGLQTVLGLGSYKTAWTWLHKFRRAMVQPDGVH